MLGIGGDLESDNITDEIDILYSEIKSAAKKDFSKWEDDYKDNNSIFYIWNDRDDYTTVDEEIQYIKSWITAQHGLFLTAYP